MITICAYDYPKKLPKLVPEIVSYLQSGDDLQIYAGLQGLYALSDRYEYNMGEDREALYKIIDETFSVLGNLINKMTKARDSEDVLHMLYLIC